MSQLTKSWYKSPKKDMRETELFLGKYVHQKIRQKAISCEKLKSNYMKVLGVFLVSSRSVRAQFGNILQCM